MTNNSLFSKQIHPVKQAIFVFAGSMVFTFLFKIFDWIGLAEAQDHMPWTMSAAALLFFSIFNSVMSLAFDDQKWYWMRSFLAFVGLIIVGGMVSYLLSGVPIGEAKSFKWLYLVFSIGYLVFLSIVRLIRKIVLIAKKQDKKLRGEE
ncbi:MAG: hypothetical protein V3V00_08595 [Saprospiraceae bacterium]